ncbi:MAG: hypothetical protein ACR2LC_03250 [Pyrinomonadaceae bacterium]
MPLFTFVLLLLLSLLTCPLAAAARGAVDAQTAPSTTLQNGTAVERTIGRGETQSFGVSLERNQFLQFVVDQRGIDVVVRTFAPDGKRLGQFDSPNGTDGPENVSLIAKVSGVYRIEVAPLEQQENTASGRYEIKILDLRAATKQELQSGADKQAIKDKGLALLAEVADGLQGIRLPETRVRAQMQAAQLLWSGDEKRARKLVDEATAGIKEYLANVDTEDQQTYYQSYQIAVQLRSEMLTTLTTRDPELALGFLRSTRLLADPNDGRSGGNQQNQEVQFELSLANQIAAKDPKRALQIAEENLGKGYSYNLIETLNRLQTTSPEASVKLASEITAKLQDEELLKNQEASNLIANLLRITRQPQTNKETANGVAVASKPPLLTEQQYRELFNKALTAALAYTPPATNFYSPERNSAQMILSSLQSMTAEMEKYAPGKMSLVQKRTIALNTPPDPQSRLWQKYQDVLNNNSLDAALESVNQAPSEIREQLYQQVAIKAAAAGDAARAKQILTDHVSNPVQRQQALKNLEQQSVYAALRGGKIEDALRIVNTLRTPKERALMLVQLVNQIGAGQKRDAALNLLEQARGMIGTGGRAEDQEQMFALFEIGRAYIRLEPKRAFDIIEPLVDQFNEMSAAAMPLNGFGQQFFKDGELLMQNGNVLGNIATQLITTVGTFAIYDFDRAKATADRMQRPEVRLFAYLSIAQHAINQGANEGAGRNINLSRGDN